MRLGNKFLRNSLRFLPNLRSVAALIYKVYGDLLLIVATVFVPPCSLCTSSD